jgi:hypothetical protein
MNMTWPIFTLRADGYLYDEDGGKLQGTPCFANGREAEQWLVDNDERGSVA